MRIAVATGCCLAAVIAGCGGNTPDTAQGSTGGSTSIVAPHSHVVSDYHPVVQQLYIAYFGRPADPGGLANFAAELDRLHAPNNIQALTAAYANDPGIRAVVDSFGASEESRTLYPGDTVTFITAIYRNVLNRAPDAEGLNFWVTAIDQRGLSRANASLAIMAGALTNGTAQGQADAALVNRRVSAGSAFTSALSSPDLVNAYRGNNAAAIARDMLSTITQGSDAAAVQAAISSTLPLLSQATGAPAASELPAPVPSATMIMTCPDGPTFACSGGSVLRTENDVLLTSSGVQVHGRSTSDMATPNTNLTNAFGLALSTTGTAEVRLAKDAGGTVSNAALLLSGLGLSWDGRVERPPIVEAFRTVQGRTLLGPDGALAFSALPASSDLSFYNFATLGTSGTQANYANNAYFPRAEPPRCEAGVSPCPTSETSGIQSTTGDWRAGGATPDSAGVIRLHEDGDVHAGNGTPGANGSPTVLPGGTGIGVPFPGSKGYRQLFNWSYQYANLATWLTQDTVLLADWGATGDEHNKNRRGVVAFGNVTDPASVPASGTATYSGIVYGWRGSSAATDPTVFRGTANITVDFATRRVHVSLTNVSTYDAAATAITMPSYVPAAAGATSTNVANYFTGDINTVSFSGGLGGRFFGPVGAGGSGTGPAEIAGTLSLSSRTDGTSMIGGFIGRRQ
ncbi:MAG TPA: DUF4214 domain-containing protein [Noviherbaspirillum sp.]|nr:DUF4214 domain-containing protein [Noviherbaspirillum sp.]